jgi:hypothetical protein
VGGVAEEGRVSIIPGRPASGARAGIPILLVLYNRDLTQAMVVGLLYLPFELVLGVWLIVKGFN